MMMVKGRSDLFLRLEIIKKVMVVPLLVLAVPRGVMAICLVPVAHELVDLALGTWCVRHVLGFREAKPLQDYGVYMPLALLACVPAFFLCRSALSPWIVLPAAILSAFVLYYMLLFRNTNMRELIRIVREELM